MKTKLIKINDIYTLLGEDNKMIASDDIDFQSDYKIGKLSKQNCDEVFGKLDVYRDAIDYAARQGHPSPEGFSDEQVGLLHGYIDGFNKAMELSKDKLFTIEDMGKLWDFCINNKSSFWECLESIQQPIEIEVEIECMFSVEENGESTNTGITKLDSNGCLILKKI
jgi:hypothetical protein